MLYYHVVLGADSIQEQDILGVGFQAFQGNVGTESFNGCDLDFISVVGSQFTSKTICQLVLQLVIWAANGRSGPGKAQDTGSNLGDFNPMRS